MYWNNFIVRVDCIRPVRKSAHTWNTLPVTTRNCDTYAYLKISLESRLVENQVFDHES